MRGNFPFLLKPCAKDYLWGGNRINDDFHKNIDLYPLAETWECSTHPDGQSIVASGEYKGHVLGDVLKDNPSFLGDHPLTLTGGKPELPVLVKLIDAKQDLSVQVHPDDDYALSHENDRGKTEMWYVLSARPGSCLVYGFCSDVTEEELRNALSEGRIGSYLNHVNVSSDDVFFIERIHFKTKKSETGIC